MKWVKKYKIKEKLKKVKNWFPNFLLQLKSCYLLVYGECEIIGNTRRNHRRVSWPACRSTWRDPQVPGIFYRAASRWRYRRRIPCVLLRWSCNVDCWTSWLSDPAFEMCPRYKDSSLFLLYLFRWSGSIWLFQF